MMQMLKHDGKNDKGKELSPILQIKGGDQLEIAIRT